MKELCFSGVFSSKNLGRNLNVFIINVVVVFVVVCLVVVCVDLSLCMFLCFALAARHEGSGHRFTHTECKKREWKSNCGVCVSCVMILTQHIFMFCQRGHQLW